MKSNPGVGAGNRPAVGGSSWSLIHLRGLFEQELKPDGIRVATLTIAGQIVAGTSFDPDRIAERYWEVVHADGPWQAEFRFTGE